MIPTYRHSFISWLMRTKSDLRIKTVKAHTNIDGAFAIIKDKLDGQHYVMSLRPIPHDTDIKNQTPKERKQKLTAERLILDGGFEA